MEEEFERKLAGGVSAQDAIELPGSNRTRRPELGTHATVIRPAALVARVLETAADLARRYNTSP